MPRLSKKLLKRLQTDATIAFHDNLGPFGATELLMEVARDAGVRLGFEDAYEIAQEQYTKYEDRRDAYWRERRRSRERAAVAEEQGRE
jgi:hypothetical protein